ncbi:MAG: beta-L-arabinofuranosidase domain-containing protein [Mangrovibacterium sp.]
MKQQVGFSIFLIVLFTFSYLRQVGAQSQYPGQHIANIKVDLKKPIKAYAFDLRDVKLLDSPFKENEKRLEKYLWSLDNNRLLLEFRIKAGMNTGCVQPYEDWEALTVELRGHTTGRFLSGLALMYTSTGDECYKLKGDSLVRELAEIQETLGQGGYLSAFPQQLIDRVIGWEVNLPVNKTNEEITIQFKQ